MQNTTLATGLTIQQQEQQDPKLMLPSDYLLSLLTVYYDCIVGSPAQVQAGMATHASITAALAACPTNGSIYILRGTYNESPLITNQIVNIVGQGWGTVINGNFSFDVTSRCTVSRITVQGNIVFTVNSSKNFLSETFIAGVAALIDNGVDNVWSVIN